MNNPDQDMIDMIAKATPETEVNEEHRDKLRRQVLDAYDQRDVKTEHDHTPLFKFTGATVMKIAASFALLAAVGFFAVTALSPSKAIAFEDVARAILKIENTSFEITSTITYADGKTENEGTFKCMTKLPALMRTEMPDGDIMIIDFAKDKMLMIDPEKKAALVMDEFFEFNESDDVQKNLFGEVQEHLRNAEKGGDFGEIKYEKLGEKKIDGKQVVGFRVLNPDADVEDFEADEMSFNVLDIWADAKTGGPVYLEFTMDLEDGSRVTSTFRNFSYNQKLDPKLFSFEAPEGYELIDGSDLIRIGQVFGGEGEIGEGIADANKQVDEFAAELEKQLKKLGDDRPTTDDVIKALRAYTQQTGGELPDNLTMTGMFDGMMKGWKRANPGKPLFVEDATDVTFTDEQLNRNTEVITKASTYLEVLNATGGTYTYRGKGVSVKDERTPVLWLQAKGAPAYTVIYNDFSVREMNEGPPPLLDDVAAIFRDYAARVGGKFPPSLGTGEIIDAVVEAWEKENPGKELFNDDVSYTDKKLNSFVDDLLQDFKFFDYLQHEGGITYAGKGIKIGDKQTPVLWFKERGKDAYTVLYGDLQVKQEAEAPAKP